MSTTMSSRPFRPPVQDIGVAGQQPSSARTASSSAVSKEHAQSSTVTRSQQLARALQSAEEQMASPQFRPDSMWTEADADVVWQGKGLNEVPSPMMRSPALHSIQTPAQEQPGEFADADEGSDSEEMHSASADDNTTFTTLSTSGSSGRKSSANTSFQSPSAFAMPSSKGAPLRPQRKAPRPPVSPVVHVDQDLSHEFDPDDDGPFGRDDAQSHYGHVRDSSVGSSIFAGRGAKPKATGAHLAQRPPVPALPNALKSPFLDDNIPAYPKERRDSVAETNSVYSQGGATPDWNDHRGPSEAPTASSKGEKGETSTDRDGEFEMMDTQSIYEGRTQPTNPPSSSSEHSQGQRRLADGTVVPKMPPVPLEYQGAQSEPKQPRSRSQRGRKNRSPILSYADGEEEERRLVQESELREHGGMEVLTTSSSLGPRLKKNSPAPWEMDEDAETLSQPDSLSAGMPNSRPSMDNLLSASSIKNPTQWARQSMETFRNRSTSSGHAVNTSTSAQTTSSSSSSSAKWSSNAFPTSASQHGLSPLANGETNSTFPRSPLSGDHQADVSQGASSTDEAAPVRRARTKSVSGSAAVMLKGLGLATSSSSNAPTKKSSSSRLAKAFRSSSKSAGNSANAGNGATSDSSSRGKQASLNLSRGISSDDYAHLPPSPQVNSGGATLSVGGHSPYLTHSSANSHASLSPRSDAGLGASADSNMRTSPSPSPFLSSNTHIPQMPVRKASAGMTSGASPVSANHGVAQSSLDGHSFGGSSNSHNAGSTGPTRGVDSIDQIIEATNNKFANQSLTPGAQLRNLTPSSFGTNASSVDTTAESFTSPATSVAKPASAIASSSEVNSLQLKSGPVLQSKASPAAPSFATGSAGNGYQGVVGANSLDAGRSSGGSGGHRSQDSQPFSDAADRNRATSNTQSTSHPPGARSSDDQMHSVPVMRMPGVGAHEGVPYKLISLEQARQQQQQLNRQQPKQRDDAHGDSHSLASEKAAHGDSSSSLSDKTLKGKKSGGFLRRFGKEKGEMSMNSSGSDGFGPLPSFGPSIQLQHAQQKESTDPSSGQSNVPPTLSVRPMSSMFNGLSVVGLLDDSMTSSAKTEQAQTATEQSSTGQLTPSSANFGSRGPVRSGASAGGLSPRSPAFTVKSVESAVSAGEYYDAMERASPMDSTLTLKKQSHLSPQDPTIAGAHRNLSASPAVSTRLSSDSLRSDTSSALGLVSGFPALPATGHGATAASLTSKARTSGNGDLASLASATRQRALEIEAKLTELHLELHKLRSFAVESGLARNATVVDANGQVQALSSPKPAQTPGVASGADSDVDPNAPASMPTTPAMTASSGAGGSAKDDEMTSGGQLESVPQSPTTPNIMQTPIPPCVQCGCSCLEEKRLQSLNELAILKGISVLDRGRALKPLAGQNGSKFGGYLDR